MRALLALVVLAGCMTRSESDRLHRRLLVDAGAFSAAVGLPSYYCGPLDLSTITCSSVLNGRPAEFDCSVIGCNWTKRTMERWP